MAVSQNPATLGTDRTLMIEAKSQPPSHQSLSTDQRGIPKPLAHEFGALQLKMLCEIAAFSCLTSHGDLIERTQKSLNKYDRPGETCPAVEIPEPMR